MVSSYEDLQGSVLDKADHPSNSQDNYNARRAGETQMAGDVLKGPWPIDPADIQGSTSEADLRRAMGHMGARGARALGSDLDSVKPINPASARILRGYQP